MRISRRNRPATTETYLKRINLVVDHIVGHQDEPLRLLTLSQIAKLSPFHFHRVFQAIVGATPADFVKRLRLDKALGLMAGFRSPSLTAVALTCGFASSSDFSRSFRQRFGVSPSEFNISDWRDKRMSELTGTVPKKKGDNAVRHLPPRSSPDHFKVRIREIPARSVAYIRITKPYESDAVTTTAKRLLLWAERHGLADGEWLGYQWDNPEVTPLKDCRYHVAVAADQFIPKGEIGRFRFPDILVAEVTIRGDIELELRAIQWLYGSWLPHSGYVPDDHPCFEAWIGRPFAHGTERFELHLQLPVRRF